MFESGGKQHRVTEGERLYLEKLNGVSDDHVVFDRVLMIDDGDSVKIGQPYIEGGAVEGVLLEPCERDRKIPVVKFKRRKNYLRMGSHRQSRSLVKIVSISG
ncbi:MAG: 50S ribosomal protein L21 [Pseudomonadales bacterium]|nr:50S ribosomal protein L21 [Pseudomonadales bacterium]